jgi:hypothetical protein
MFKDGVPDRHLNLQPTILSTFPPNRCRRELTVPDTLSDGVHGRAHVPYGEKSAT